MLALCALALARVVLAASGDSGIVLSPQEVAPDVFFVQGAAGQASHDNRGFTSNAGFVITGDGVVVFDALGTPALGDALLAAIRARTSQPVRRVIVSHYHADHVYGLPAFKAAGAQIWARSEGQNYLRSEIAQLRLEERRKSLAPWIGPQTTILAADRWLQLGAADAQQFRLGNTQFRLISAGHAHAVDDLMLFVESRGVLFAGDVFFSARLPFVADGNTKGWLAAIDSMKAVGAPIVVPGHGPASVEVARDLTTTERYVRFLRTELAAAVAELQTFEEAYDSIDWSAFATLPTFDAANRRNAHSVYLEMQEELLRQER